MMPECQNTEITWRSIAEDFLDEAARRSGTQVPPEHWEGALERTSALLSSRFSDPYLFASFDALGHFSFMIPDEESQEWVVNPSAVVDLLQDLLDSIDTDRDDPDMMVKIRTIAVTATLWYTELGKMWMAQAEGGHDEVEDGVTHRARFIPLGIRINGERPLLGDQPTLDPH